MLRLKLKRLRYNLSRTLKDRSGPVLRVLFACVTSFFSIWLLHSAAGERAESELLRSWFWLRGARTAPTDIAIISMDSRTKQALKIPDRDPIPRTAIAKVLETLAPTNPKAVIFDTVLEGEGPTPEADQQLAAAIAKVPSVLAMSSMLEIEGRDEKGEPIRGRRRVVSLPLFVQNAKKMIPMQVMLTGNVVERLALPIDPTLPLVPLVEPLRQLIDPTIPMPSASDLVNYYGPPFTFKTVPMHRLLGDSAQQEAEELRGKVLFIGWMERSINGVDRDRRDSFLTPISDTPMYGVEIHANIAGNLLERSWLRRLTPEGDAIIVLFVTLIGTLLAAGRSALQMAGLTLGYVSICLAVSYFAFTSHQYFIPAATSCVLVLPATMLLLAFWTSKREERRRQKLQQAIGLAPETYRRGGKVAAPDQLDTPE